MKKIFWCTIGGPLLALSGLIAVAAATRRDTAEEMARAATNFVALLTSEQRAKAVLPFEGDAREDWHYIPKAKRKGLPFKEMSSAQAHLAHVLLNASLSAKGYGKAATIMSLEDLVKELEAARGGGPMLQLRDPNLYYVTIFGEPSVKATWGWGIEGHHVSQNFTVVGGKMIASSPEFFGAEPHEVLQGPRKGLRVLGAEEDLARALLASLDEKQMKQAVLAAQAPNDIFSAAKRKVEFEAPPKGLAGAAMNEKQKTMLRDIIDEYITNLPPDVAERRRARAEKSPIDQNYFAWMGSTTKGPGQGHYYRVQGTTFLIEYDNIQNEANHSHSVWRDYDGDFGRDLLAEHHQKD